MMSSVEETESVEESPVELSVDLFFLLRDFRGLSLLNIASKIESMVEVWEGTVAAFDLSCAGLDMSSLTLF